MNKAILGFSILMAASTCFASSTNQANHTNMKSAHWICTTNASSSDVAADKTADEKMAQQKMAAKEAFEFAAKHCRDCTKITCEAQDDSSATTTNSTTGTTN